MSKGARTALIIGGAILAVLILVPLVIRFVVKWPAYRYGYEIGPWMMGGYGGWWFMPIIMIIFWGLVIWGIVALVRGVASPDNSGSYYQADSALEILKRRYAQGEITKQEYEERKKDLAS